MNTTPTSFQSFSFSPEMDRAIQDLGFDQPTPIQLGTLPLLLNQKTDFLGLAATGTGKTAAYAIPLLENMKELSGKDSKRKVQGLILCPTRELAKQVAEQINALARYKKTKALAIYGGSDYAGQMRALKDGVSIVVGTPGRIIDHLDRGTLNLNDLQTVILDEADEMISMGFKSEIELILTKVKQEVKHQTWLFSATMSRDVRKIADQFLTSPKQIQVNKTETMPTTVKQFFYQTHEYDKPDLIKKIMDLNPGFYGLIFCQTKALVSDLTQTLKSDGYAVDCLHGDMEQSAREKTLKAFKARNLTVLVCTDVASRGIDVKELTHVVNYSIPRELDLYVHRIGRTGRGGKEGIALSLVTPSHLGLVNRIEKMTQTTLVRIPVPTDEELMTVRVSMAFEKFNLARKKHLARIPALQEALKKGAWAEQLSSMSKEEIAATFLADTLGAPQPATNFVASEPERPAKKFFSKGSEFSKERGRPGFKTDRKFGAKSGPKSSGRPFGKPQGKPTGKFTAHSIQPRGQIKG